MVSRVGRVQLTRRSLLTRGALGLATTSTAACRRTSPPAKPDADVALRATALQREQDLLAAYRAVITARPALAARLRPLATDKEAHVAVLGAPVTTTPTTTPTTPTSAAVTTVAQLRVLERSTAAAHAAAALTASRSFAPQLASLAAASSAALAVL